MHETPSSCDTQNTSALCPHSDDNKRSNRSIIKEVLGTQLGEIVVNELEEDQKSYSKKYFKIVLFSFITLIIIGVIFLQNRTHFLIEKAHPTAWEWIGEKQLNTSNESLMIQKYQESNYLEVKQLFQSTFSPYALFIYATMLSEQNSVDLTKIEQIIAPFLHTSVSSMEQVNWIMLKNSAFLNRYNSHYIFECNQKKSIRFSAPQLHHQFLSIIKSLKEISGLVKAKKFQTQYDFVMFQLAKSYVCLWLIEGHVSYGNYHDNQDAPGVNQREIALKYLANYLKSPPNPNALALLKEISDIIEANWAFFDGIYFDGKTYYMKESYEKNQFIKRLNSH